MPQNNLFDVTDGYHVGRELYHHRCLLFIALMRSNPKISWRAKKHSDGTMPPDWFIAGMNLPTGQISYHLPVLLDTGWLWEMLDNCGIATTDKAPEVDGHTAADVVDRLSLWAYVL